MLDSQDYLAQSGVENTQQHLINYNITTPPLIALCKSHHASHYKQKYAAIRARAIFFFFFLYEIHYNV
jgi:hypothetical protein